MGKLADDMINCHWMPLFAVLCKMTAETVTENVLSNCNIHVHNTHDRISDEPTRQIGFIGEDQL